ncbi:MAG: hypothetical protein RBJ76_00060 (plasmid) [Stenomitos frigidus ULC029]
MFNKAHPGILIGYRLTIALILLTGALSISAAKQQPDNRYTGFDVTQP